MSEPMLNGLMMDDYPLSLTALVERAEPLTAESQGRLPAARRHDAPDHDGRVRAPGPAARRRARRARHRRGRPRRDADVEPARAPRGVLRRCPRWAPSSTRSIPACTPTSSGSSPATPRTARSSSTSRSCRRSTSFRAAHEFEHVIVVSHSGEVPDGTIDYESLIEGARADGRWPEPHERRAAAICYTSGTTGRPKGVLYSHRALVLHSMAAALPDAMNVSTRDIVLPVVPMFHANAWGIPYTATHDRRRARPARARSSTPRACSTSSPTSTSRSPPACRRCGWRCSRRSRPSPSDGI